MGTQNLPQNGPLTSLQPGWSRSTSHKEQDCRDIFANAEAGDRSQSIPGFVH